MFVLLETDSCGNFGGDTLGSVSFEVGLYPRASSIFMSISWRGMSGVGWVSLLVLSCALGVIGVLKVEIGTVAVGDWFKVFP